MDLTWILLGLLGWGLGLLFVLVLMRVARADRAARRERKRRDPRTDGTGIRTGESTGGRINASADRR